MFKLTVLGITWTVVAALHGPPPALRAGTKTQATFFGWYDRQLTAAPLRTKMASSGLVSCVGDCAAQLLTTSSYDIRRNLTWALCGLLYFAPFLHFYYAALARFEKRALDRGVRRRTAVAVQLLLNQTVGAASVNALFFFVFEVMVALLALVLDQSFVSPVVTLSRAAANLQAKFPSIMLANWAIWPLPSLANLLFVPLQYRVLFTNTVALVWKCVLSVMTSHSHPAATH